MGILKFLGGYNFKEDLKNKIENIYKEQALDHGIKEKELKEILKEKRDLISKNILSQAEVFWKGREEPPNSTTLFLAKRPYIPNLIENWEIIQSEKNLSFVQYHDLIISEEKTIKPIYEDVRKFIEDERGLVKENLLKYEKKYGPFFVKNQLETDKNIIRLFKFLETEFDFSYGSDKENFGYHDLWLTPTQILLLQEKFSSEKRNLKIDCEDMHNFAASHLYVMGVPDLKYRCVMGETSPGSGGHLTLYILEDNLHTWRNIEFTPHKRNLNVFSSTANFPKFGEDGDVLKGKNIILSYDKNNIYATFNANAKKDEFKDFVNKISIEFSKDDFI
ncbi:MAG: hypothetical protein QW051_01275 [Candidatus Aenigmatarchaeota archaeon]